MRFKARRQRQERFSSFQQKNKSQDFRLKPELIRD